MKLIASATILTAAALVAAAPAHALTITNNDSKDRTFGVDMGDKEKVEKLSAGKSVSMKSECDTACGITGPWGYSWMAKSGDTLVWDGKALKPSNL